MNLVVNGQSVEVPAHVITVQQVLSHFGLEHRMAIVELNAEIVEKHRYTDRRVDDGARIEIVHFVGGG